MRSTILRGNFMGVPFDRVADIYDKTRGYSSQSMEKVIDALKRELEGSTRALDIGMGTGRFSEPLQRAGIEVVGIDLSRKMMEKAREKGTANMTVADARMLPFRDSSFDDAISVHVLHLIREWQIALREISRVTRNHLISIGKEGPGREHNPGERYVEILKSIGYEASHPGLAEPRLNDPIRPAKSEFIVEDKGDTGKTLESLENKAYAIQWNVPDDLHGKAMGELKREFRGKPEYSNDLYLYKWKTSDIVRYLDRANGREEGRGE
jgi:SAM-dependent methyltransferase